VLSIVLFFFLPTSLLGWVMTPIGTLITLFVLLKWVKGESFGHYATVALVWTALAMVLDYLFIVRLFHPADGYYKTDVYLYYASTFVLPLAVGLIKTRKRGA